MLAKSIYIIGVVLGLLPPFHNNNPLVHKFHKSYSLVLIITIIMATIFSILARTVEVYVNMTSGSSVIDAVSQSSMSLVSISVIVFPSVRYSKEFRRLKHIFLELEAFLGTKVYGKKPTVNLILMNFLILLFTLYGIVVTKSDNTLYAILYFTFYYISLSVFLIYNCVSTLGTHLKNFNDKLFLAKGMFKNYPILEEGFLSKKGIVKRINTLHSEEELFETKLQMMHNIRSFYNKATKITTLLNKIYGWPFLFLTLTIGIGLLDVSNWTVEIIVDADNYYKGRTFEKYGTFFYTVSDITSKIVMGVVIATTCDMTAKEAQRTAAVCYALLVDVPTGSKNKQDRILCEELILLSQQATHRYPYFSAAGFFRVNYSMLFGLFGTVTSYIIVLIQINK